MLLKTSHQSEEISVEKMCASVEETRFQQTVDVSHRNILENFHSLSHGFSVAKEGFPSFPQHLLILIVFCIS